MTDRLSHFARQTLSGAFFTFAAEFLLMPTGLLVAAYLTRQFGPKDYGIFVLVVSLISWTEWTVVSAFSRTTVKFISIAEDWRQVGISLLHLSFATGIGAALILIVLAGPISVLMDEPILQDYIRLLAFDIPIFSLSRAYQNILAGIGSFRERALSISGRWIARLLFSVFLVSIGLSIIGAILALIVASLVELAVARYFSRLPFLRRSSFPIKSFWGYAIPLFFTAVVFRLFDQLGLYFLKVLGGSVEEVGYYGAAQNLALLPALFSITLAPILLSALGYLQSEDDEQHSLELSRNTMRLVIILLPFVGIVAGAAQEIVVFIFGSAFAPSATLLKVLIFGGEALVMVQVATSILIAAGRPNLNLNLSLMMLVFVCVGYILLIPSFGGVGAAFATTIVSFIGALTAVLLVHRIWRVHPPVGTLLRSGFICVIGYILAERLSTPGLWVILKMVVLGLLSLLALIVLGEFSSKEFAFMRSLLARSANIETDLREVREEQELLEGDNL